MGKRASALFFLLHLTVSLALFAETAAKSVQIVMPEKPCVGDTVELRYIFHADTAIVGGERTHLDLPLSIPAFVAQSEQCEVLSAVLDRVGSEYTLSLRLVGWHVGQIAFAPFAIGGYEVALEPIEIYSIVEKTGASGFRPPSPPLVVPGTAAVLGVLAVVFLLVLGGAVFALFHIPAIADFLLQTRAERRSKRNMRTALKKIRALSAKSDSLDDKQFCAALQHILRGYLSQRFGRDFAPVHTAALYETISAICGGDLTDEQDAVVQSLAALFVRTDYIRYAKDELNAGERETLVNAAADVVNSIFAK